ncbi:MAG: nitroreductase family protein [Emergencia sp.]
MKTREAIARRCSCRAYKPYQISEKELNIVLQAGNAAPVGMGKYETLKMTVIMDGELLEKIDAEGSKFFGDPSVHPLYGAPVFILVSAQGDDVELGMCNASCIIENMALAAADIGLGSCYIRGNVKAVTYNKALCEEMKVPEGFVPCGGIVLGYPLKEPETRELVTDRIATEYVK